LLLYPLTFVFGTIAIHVLKLSLTTEKTSEERGITGLSTGSVFVLSQCVALYIVFLALSSSDPDR
jgi:hypothetical protein